MTRALWHCHDRSFPISNHFCLRHQHTINFTLHRSSSWTIEKRNTSANEWWQLSVLIFPSISSPSLPSFLILLPLPSFLSTCLSFLLLPSSFYPFFVSPSLFLPPFLSFSFASFLHCFLPSFLLSFPPSHSNVPVLLLNTSTCTFLYGRLFAYSDTQRYRLGVNHPQLPVNCPFGSPGVTNCQRDGHDPISIRLEQQIIVPVVSVSHRICQVLPSASSVSQEMLRGEAASSVCLCATWSHETTNSASWIDLK